MKHQADYLIFSTCGPIHASLYCVISLEDSLDFLLGFKMILSDEDLHARLSSPENLSSKVEIKKPNPNSGNRGEEIPEIIRELIAITAAKSDEREVDIGEAFGVTQPFVSQVKRGMVHQRKDERLTEIVRNATEQKEQTAHELALDNLVQGLNFITPKLAEVEDIRTLSRITRDMASVVKDIGAERSDATASKVIINMVNLKKETSYDIIDV